jgi:hypothetical protein
MTYPRLQTVDPQTPGFFHCVSRCVRRAFLCGHDVYSGRSYEHRKTWVEDRLLALAECFAVGLYAYAVMSNHVHVVLHVDPQEASAWSGRDLGHPRSDLSGRDLRPRSGTPKKRPLRWWVSKLIWDTQETALEMMGVQVLRPGSPSMAFRRILSTRSIRRLGTSTCSRMVSGRH